MGTQEVEVATYLPRLASPRLDSPQETCLGSWAAPLQQLEVGERDMGTCDPFFHVWPPQVQKCPGESSWGSCTSSYSMYGLHNSKQKWGS